MVEEGFPTKPEHGTIVHVPGASIVQKSSDMRLEQVGVTGYRFTTDKIVVARGSTQGRSESSPQDHATPQSRNDLYLSIRDSSLSVADHHQ